MSGVLEGFWRSLLAWEVWTHLGIQDIKNRYKRSFVGPLWLAVSMAVMVVGMGVLFGRVFNQDQGTYIVFLAISMMLWGLVSSSVSDGGYSFIAAECYIKQIPFPKQVYILRTMVVNLIVFSIGLPVFMGAALYYRVPLHWASLWAIPGLLLLVFCCIGHITIMSYLSVIFRDLPPASSSLLQLVYFFTPVIYPVEILRQRQLDFFYLFNPFYYLMELVRFPLLEASRAPASIYLTSIGYGALVWAVALAVATALDRKIAYSL